jgi:phage shock protein C
MEGPDNTKGITNVRHFRFCPPQRDDVRRRVRFGDAAGFGRHLAVDRLTRSFQPKAKTMNGRFLVNRSHGKVMGVASGLADLTGIDVTLIRLGFIAATMITGPVMILFYVLAGLLAPSK